MLTDEELFNVGALKFSTGGSVPRVPGSKVVVVVVVEVVVLVVVEVDVVVVVVTEVSSSLKATHAP